MKVPEDKIQQVKDATDIVEVVGQYVTLKKRGKNFQGLCPFHSEKTPSFSVDPIRGFYHCFGCHAGGDVFRFVMEMEKIGFPEALKQLAEKANIPLPKVEEDSRQSQEAETLYHANQFARDFFSKCLFQTEGGKKALLYLNGRDFDTPTIEKFKLGYAPNRWDGMMLMAERESEPLDNLFKAGLIVPRRGKEGFYDRFRGRLMFPIFNISGKTVGFGGRILIDQKNSPKYLNSPETPVYQKSQILYGLFHSKNAIRGKDQALLVEGYTDVIRLHQKGVENVVATSGTALTEQQARLISRYTKNIILLYDGDSAGMNAALRGVDILITAGLNVRIAPLPAGSDPDAFVREQGPEALEKLVRESQDFIDFKLNQFRSDGLLTGAAGRAKATSELLALASKIKDPMERNITVKDLSEKMGVDEALLMAQIKKKGAAFEPAPTRPETPMRTNSAETGLIRVFLQYPAIGKKVFQLLEEDDIQSPAVKKIAAALGSDLSNNKPTDPSELLIRFQQEAGVTDQLTRMMAQELPEEIDHKQFAIDCLVRLKQNAIKRKIEGIREKIKSLQSQNQETAGLNREYVRLKQDLLHIHSKIVESWQKSS